MDWDALVVVAGGRVEGWGRLVRHASGTWFQPPGATPAIADADPRIAPPGPGAVRVVGADFGELADRRSRDSDTEGYAAVRGRWDGATLTVDHQAPRRSGGPPHVPHWDTPPCPEPAEGWPDTGGAGLEVDLGTLPRADAAVAVTLFRPSRTQEVLVVAADDVAEVETALRPQLGTGLCVVPSRVSRAAVDDVRRELDGHETAWNLVTTGESADEQGQPVIVVGLTMVTPEIAAWAGRRPAGLLVPEPCLAPPTTPD